MIQKNIECLIAKLYSRFYISIKYCGNASKDIILREYDGNNGAGIKDKILRVSTAVPCVCFHFQVFPDKVGMHV